MPIGHPGRVLAIVALCLLAGAGVAAGGVLVPAVGAAPDSAVAGTPVSTVGAAPDPALGEDPGLAGTQFRATHQGYERLDSGGPATPAQLRSQSRGSIELTETLRHRPDWSGEYQAIREYDVPLSVRTLNFSVDGRMAVTSADGFEPAGDGWWEWDRSTPDPTVTLRVSANQTTDGEGPIEAAGNYRFVDTGAWALVLQPRSAHWYSADFRFDRTTTVEGAGAAGDVIAYMGPHETHTRTAHGQTVDLVVPDAATLAEPPEEILDSIADASDALRVGDRDESVFVVAAPTGRIEWGVRGVQTGTADAWVRDREVLGDPDSVWLHEYVHTRQDFRTAPDARWLTEAGATYYANRLAYEQDRIDFEQFRRTLARGTNERFDGAVLADQSTWRNDPQYAVGGLVTGELDRRTRLATDSGASFDTVFARLNDHDGTIDAETLQDHLRAVAGDEVAAAGRRYETTTARPTVWNASQHGAAFGVTPARFVVAYEGESAFAVAGAYRNRSLGAERPLVVVPGERLNASVTVENTGEAAGDYEVRMAVDGSTVGTASGRLRAGGSTTRILGQQFGGPGSYTLSVGDDRVDVRVREAAAPTVTAFEANRTSVDPGESVTLTVAVENDADRPAGRTIPVTRNGEQVAERTVRLDVGEGTTRTVDATLEEPGEYTFGLGAASDRSVTVVVEEQFPVGVVLVGGGAVLAVFVLVGVLLYWRRGQHTQSGETGTDTIGP